MNQKMLRATEKTLSIRLPTLEIINKKDTALLGANSKLCLSRIKYLLWLEPQTVVGRRDRQQNKITKIYSNNRLDETKMCFQHTDRKQEISMPYMQLHAVSHETCCIGFYQTAQLQKLLMKSVVFLRNISLKSFAQATTTIAISEQKLVV